MKSLDEILLAGRPRSVSLEALPSVLGERIRQQRLAFEWRQSDLAVRAGVSTQTIKAMETGANVSLLSFLQVLNVLGHGPDLVHLLERPHFPSLEAMSRHEALLQGASGPASKRRMRLKSDEDQQ